MRSRTVLAVRRAIQMTLLALAALVVLFVATWLTIPEHPTDKVSPPASLFISGITKPQFRSCIDYEPTGLDPPNAQECVRFAPVGSVVEIPALERRVKFLLGGAAAVIVLVGLAFGAGRRASAPEEGA